MVEEETQWLLGLPEQKQRLSVYVQYSTVVSRYWGKYTVVLQV